MALADRFAHRGAPYLARTSLAITCPRYQPTPGTKRCQHYEMGGGCALPDEPECVEWRKANPASAAPDVAPGGERDLFGQPVKREPAPPRRDANAPLEFAERAALLTRPLTDEDSAAFEVLGVEVCLATDGCGEIWLVPVYTGRTDRRELSARDAATIAAVCAAFPGAQVTRFEKPRSDEPAEPCPSAR